MNREEIIRRIIKNIEILSEEELTTINEAIDEIIYKFGI